jgi:hypothetical protein
MSQIRFETITESLRRLPDVIRQIPDIWHNPAANPMQAAILLGIALILALIVLLTVVLVVLRPHEEDEFFDDEGGIRTRGPAVTRERPKSRLTMLSVVVLAAAAVWVSAGVTTASPDVCLSCHANSAHHAARSDDPHAGVRCVSCHESGGAVAQATVNLATRAQHFLLGKDGSARANAYGKPVASDACIGCHRDQIAGVFDNRGQGVRVSHKEPLAAGAQCADCHVLKSGVVGSATVGMKPCLRCHNGTTAKAACSTCHAGDPAAAIRSSVASDAMASAQVPHPECTGCHTDMTSCNKCHGISMPHTPEFMAYGHARAGAIAIWNNDLKMCRKCHYPGHRDCSNCHSGPFPSHPLSWRKLHQLATPNAGGCLCHEWNPIDHGGMNLCQVCHPERRATATR